MKLKDIKKTVSTKKASLGRALKKNEKIKQTVKKAASELTLVNEVLKQEKIPVQVMKQALTQNEGVEQEVAKAADDLKLVNVKLAEEMAERIVIESELADTKTDLAEVRDDLSKAEVKAEETQQIALQDALMGLPNHVTFEQGLDHGLMLAKRHGWGLAVLFIDIDKFKTINDSYGHDQGNQGQLMLANHLQSSVCNEDIVSRWGGDEFARLLLEVKQEADVTSFTRSFRASFIAPKQDIQAWIKDTPGLNETTPDELSDNKVQYIIAPGVGANTAEVTIDYGLNRVEIYVSWG